MDTKKYLFIAIVLLIRQLFPMDSLDQATKLQTEQTSFRRLVLLLDPKESEVVFDYYGDRLKFLSSYLEMALLQESTPVIVSKDIFKHILALKLRTHDEEFYKKRSKFSYLPFVKKIIHEIYSEILSKKIPDSDIEKNLNEKDIPQDKLGAATTYQIPLYSDYYYVLDCPETSLFLIIPKKYLRTILGYEELRFDEDKTLGFNVSQLKQIKLPNFLQRDDERNSDCTKSYEAILKIIDEKPKSFASSDLAKVITTKDQAKNLFWNIFLSGHGEQEEKKEDGTVREPAQIAGLDVPIFQEVLSFFNNDLRTLFLYYTTCFGGGKNLHIPYGLQKYNFTIISGAVTDSEVSQFYRTRYLGYSVIHGKIVHKPAADFLKFFHDLENIDLFDLKRTLRHVTSLAGNIRAMPHVRYPGTDFFRLENIDDQVITITKSKCLAKAIDGSAFEILKKKAAIITTSLIPVEIYIQHMNDANQDISSQVMVAGYSSKQQAIEFVFLKPYEPTYFATIHTDNCLQFLKTDLGGSFAGAGYSTERNLYINRLIQNTKDKMIKIKTLEGEVLEKESLNNLYIHLSKGASGFSLNKYYILFEDDSCYEFAIDEQEASVVISFINKIDQNQASVIRKKFDEFNRDAELLIRNAVQIKKSILKIYWSENN